MKRTFLTSDKAAGRTVEAMIENEDTVLLLLSWDGAVYIQSGCYDEDDHYCEISYPAGLELVKQHVLKVEEALEYNLIDEADAERYRKDREAAEAQKKQKDWDTYQELKKRFGDVPIQGVIDVPVKTE